MVLIHILSFSTKEDRDDWKEKIETLVESLIATSPAPMDVEKMETDQDDISNFVPANYIRRQYKIEDFVTLKTIGKGTFGNVVLVYRRDDPRQVRMALKVIDKRVIRQKVKFLDPNILENPDPVKSFRKFKTQIAVLEPFKLPRKFFSRMKARKIES